MKYILIPFILFFFFQNLTAQTNAIPDIVGLDGAERIFNSFQNHGSDRTFEDRPDSIFVQTYYVEHPSQAFTYSLKYEGNNIAQITYSAYTFLRRIDYSYNNEGFVTEAIVYGIDNGPATEIRRYKYHYLNKNFLDCIKVIINNEVAVGDSISLQMDGDNIIHWTELRKSNTGWDVQTDISDITYEESELRSFITTGMVYGMDPNNVYQYSNLKRLDLQKLTIFHEARLNWSDEHIDSSIFGPDDAAEIYLPVPIGADIVKINIQTGEEELIQKSRIVENGYSSSIDYYNKDNPSEFAYNCTCEFNADNKLEHYIIFAINQPERKFEYNQKGKLVKDILFLNGNETNVGTDYYYEYNADEKLTFYTNIFRNAVETYFSNEYYFYYNGSLKNKTIEKEQITIYPNPVGDILNINSLSNLIGVDITDALGRTVLRSTAAKNIDIKHLNPGTYFAKVDTNNGSSVVKFIKQ